MLLRCKGNMKSLINIYSLRILSFFKPRLILSSQLEKERVQLVFVLQKHLSWLTALGSTYDSCSFQLVTRWYSMVVTMLSSYLDASYAVKLHISTISVKELPMV